MGVVASRESEIAKQSKSSLAALSKKAGEIPLSLLNIGARDAQMEQEPMSGPIADTATSR